MTKAWAELAARPGETIQAASALYHNHNAPPKTWCDAAWAARIEALPFFDKTVPPHWKRK